MTRGILSVIVVEYTWWWISIISHNCMGGYENWVSLLLHEILFYRFTSLRISIKELLSRFKLNSLKSAFARVISIQVNSSSSDYLYGKFASCYFSYNYIMQINTSNQWARFRGDLGARSFFWTIPPGNFYQPPAYAISSFEFSTSVKTLKQFPGLKTNGS